MDTNNININELKKNFLNIKNEYRTVPFYHLDGDISDEDAVLSQLNGFKKSGYGGVVLLPVSETRPIYGTDAYYKAYEKILEKAKKLGLSVIYYDDLDFPSGWAGGELAEKYPAALAKQLCRRELTCTSGEHTRFKLVKEGRLMSVVAVENDTRETIDLRDYIEDDCAVWDTPEGNWIMQQYYVTTLPDTHYVNYLDYDACRCFINLTYKRFTDMFGEYIGETVIMTFYDDIQYNTPNRRMWDDDFNRVFFEKYGFDPAPYYPALFDDIKEDTDHYKALFMNCRAEMLADGFFRAVSDFTKAHGLVSTGHVAESKSASAPWLFGDGMLYQKYAGACGLDLVHRYLYGSNGLKLASSSAYNYDRELVCCEIFGNYAKLNSDIMYREAMNAFARGINFLIPHTLWLSGVARIPHEVSHRNPEFRDILHNWNDFAARAQTMLRGGRHVCDIALLYPIYSLEAQTSLFITQASGFEFPKTPVNADYMNVINSVLNYCGHDLTVLHPDILNEKCHSDDGILYLGNEVNFEQYKLLIMPGTSQISVKSIRIIKKFFDDGGKIIATDALPFRAFEFSPANKEKGINTYDDEVRETVEYIFGVKKDEINAFETYYENKNDAGGAAYYILPSKTAADGTDLVDSQILSLIIDSKLNIAHDVIIENMPRIQNSGILNLALPMFVKMNVLGGTGGLFNYIHRKYAGCDIYYFSNSTNTPYEGSVSLHGEYTVCEEWNPHTGKIKKSDFEYTDIKDKTYTLVTLSLDPASSVFIVCKQ